MNKKYLSHCKMFHIFINSQIELSFENKCGISEQQKGPIFYVILYPDCGQCCISCAPLRKDHLNSHLFEHSAALFKLVFTDHLWQLSTQPKWWCLWKIQTKHGRTKNVSFLFFIPLRVKIVFQIYWIKQNIVLKSAWPISFYYFNVVIRILKIA